MNGHEDAPRSTRFAASDGSLVAGLPDEMIARMTREASASDPESAEVPRSRPAQPSDEQGNAPVAPRGDRAPAARRRAEGASPARAEAEGARDRTSGKPDGPRIDLQASISDEDLVAFNHVWGKISGERARVVWGARVWALVPIIGGVVVLFFGDYLLSVALIALGLVLAIAAGPYYRAAVRRAVKRQLAGQNPAMMGPRRIVIDPTGVFEGGRYDRLQIGWPGVVDVVLGSDAFYVFYGTMQAVIVPKRAFRSAGDFERTVHVVERLYGRRATDAKGR